MNDLLGALTQCSAETVSTSVTAADDDDVLALGIDVVSRCIAFLHLIRDGQVLHRLMDALEFASWHIEITTLGCSTRENNRIM